MKDIFKFIFFPSGKNSQKLLEKTIEQKKQIAIILTIISLIFYFCSNLFFYEINLKFVLSLIYKSIILQIFFGTLVTGLAISIFNSEEKGYLTINNFFLNSIRYFIFIFLELLFVICSYFLNLDFSENELSNFTIILFLLGFIIYGFLINKIVKGFGNTILFFIAFGLILGAINTGISNLFFIFKLF